MSQTAFHTSTQRNFDIGRLSASAAYAYRLRPGAEAEQGKVDQKTLENNYGFNLVSEIDEPTGLHVRVFKTPTNELLIAFTGSESQSTDWHNNVLHLSSRQLYNNQDNPRDENNAVHRILEKYYEDIKDAPAVHITGHSLGGALAQFFTYELAQRAGADDKYSADNINLTTFNALGGLAGLNRVYNDQLSLDALSVVNGSHYRMGLDGVSLLGDEHIGGEVYTFGNGTLEGINILDKPKKILDSHSMVRFFESDREAATAKLEEFKYLSNDNYEEGFEDVFYKVQEGASALSNIGDSDTLSEQEAFHRLVALGLISAGTLGTAINGVVPSPPPIKALIGFISSVAVYGGAYALREANEISEQTLLASKQMDIYKAVKGIVEYEDGSIPKLIKSPQDDGSTWLIFDRGDNQPSLRIHYFPADGEQSGKVEFSDESAGSFSLERRDDSTVLLNIRDPNNSQLVQLGYVGDQLYGVVAHDIKHDGSDDDYSDQNEEVTGDKNGEKNDILFGKPGKNDVIKGFKGDDQLYGMEGNDRLQGGEDNDVLYGDSGEDILEGGDGHDELYGGTGSDTLKGGLGDDTYVVRSGDGADVIIDEAGNNSLMINLNTIQSVKQIAIDQEIYQDEWGNKYYFEESPYEDPKLKIMINGSTQDVVTIEHFEKENNRFGISFELFDPVADLEEANNPFVVPPNGEYEDNSGFENKTVFAGKELRENMKQGEINDRPIHFDATTMDHDAVSTHVDAEGIQGIEKFEGGNKNDKLIGDAAGQTLVGWGGDDEIHGGAGNDVLHGFRQIHHTERESDDADRLFGGEGNDYVDGAGGNDRLQGDEGDDHLFGGFGDDLLKGGDGADYLYGEGFFEQRVVEVPDNPLANYSEGHYAVDAAPKTADQTGKDTLIGGKGADFLIGGFDDDILLGGEDGDRLEGDARPEAQVLNEKGELEEAYKGSDGFEGLAAEHHGNDFLDGGAGNDTLIGGGGDDRLVGGEGNDVIFGDESEQFHSIEGDDYIDGGLGDDVIHGGAGKDTIFGGAGHDKITGDHAKGPGGADEIHGGDHNDLILGRGGNDKLYGDAGNDTLLGGTGNDFIQGGDGEDVIAGEAGDDKLDGGEGTDRIFGGEGDDTIIGGKGDDKIEVSKGVYDGLLGGTGDDYINGGEGDDLVSGQEGDDRLIGGSGDDIITGGEGKDTLIGGTGSDYLSGGKGNDKLLGGTGADVYVFEKGFGQDVISQETAESRNAVVIAKSDFVGMIPTKDGSDLLLSAGSNQIRIQSFFTQSSAYYFQHDGSDSGAINGKDIADYLNIKDAEPTTLGTLYEDFNRQLNSHETQMTTNKKETDMSSDKDDIQDSADQWSRNEHDQELQAEEFGTGPSHHSLGGLTSNDRLLGSAVSDSLVGGEGNDDLFGGAGDDRLSGGKGDDLLVGGYGNDQLAGGEGKDIYIIERGHGHTRINQDATAYDGASLEDILRFGAGIKPSDIDVLPGENKEDLLLVIQPGGDTVSIRRFINSANQPTFEAIEFEDGTRWEPSDLLVKLNTLTEDSDQYFGSASDDEVSLKGGDDTAYGREGNDVIRGDAGNDELFGNAGNDRLEGGAGNDTLYGDEEYSRDVVGNDTLIGGEGDDKLEGGLGDDTYNAGPGDDKVQDVGGNDTYLYAKGDGDLEIIDSPQDESVDKGDVLKFTDLNPSDITLSRDNESLMIIINNTETEYDPNHTIEIKDFFKYLSAETKDSIDQIEFADGTQWNLETIMNKVSEGTEGDDEIYATDQNDRLIGKGGRDTLVGLGGDDYLDGGDGDDQLYGGAGNDTIIGGAGDDEARGFASDRNSGDDTYNLGTGRDEVIDEAGNDTYIFTKGDESLRIHDLNHDDTPSLDTLKIKGDINPNDVNVRQVRGNLRITFNGSEDEIEIERFFSGSGFNDSIEFIEFDDGTRWDKETLKEKTLDGSDADDELRGTDQADVLDGKGGNDDLYGEKGNDHLIGGAGHDSLDGGDGDDRLDGGVGDDSLRGGLGNDTLDAGKGSDTASGGQGNDTYIFNKGDGALRITEYEDQTGQNDQLHLKGYQPSDAFITRHDDTLVIQFNGSDDVVKVERFFDQLTVEDTIESIVFDNGTRLTKAEIVEAANTANDFDNTLYGTAENDNINALKGNDQLYGLGGDDTLNGGEGDDNLIGGQGKDTLLGGDGEDKLEGGDGDDVLNAGKGMGDQATGGEGADTYYFNRGDQELIIFNHDNQGLDSQDRLVFGEGISESDVQVSRYGSNLVLTLKGTEDQVTVRDMFTDSDVDNEDAINQVEFHDGTQWDIEAIKELSMKGSEGDDRLTGFDGDDVLDALEGDDYLDGKAGNDILIGGKGVDKATGGDGSDTFVFNRGDNGLVIYGRDNNENSIDTLKFGPGIKQDDLSFRKEGNHLYINVIGTGDDIRIDDFFTLSDRYNPVSDTYGKLGQTIDRILFDSGKQMLLSDIEKVTHLSEASEENDKIFGNHAGNHIIGKGGDDVLVGLEGDDVIHGGPGKDFVEGDEGDDTYLFARGDQTLEIQNFHFDVGKSQDTIKFIKGGESIQGPVTVPTEHFEFDSYFSSGLEDNLYEYEAQHKKTLIQRPFGYLENQGEDILSIKGFAPEDASLVRMDDSLVIQFNNASNVIEIQHYFAGADLNNSVELIRFENGVEWNSNAVVSMLSGATSGNDEVHGTRQDDELDGGAGDDTLTGYEGSDRLFGGDGDDILVAGKGEDQATGGNGADTYIFTLGDQQLVIDNSDQEGLDSCDTLLLKGVPVDQVKLSQSGKDLLVNIDGENDQSEIITLKDYFVSADSTETSPNAVNSIKFHTGEQITPTSLQMIMHEGMTIPESSSAYSEITENDINIYVNENRDLMIEIRGTTDLIEVHNQYNSSIPMNVAIELAVRGLNKAHANKLQRIVLTDGTEWVEEKILEKALSTTEYDDLKYFFDDADIKRGQEGNDELHGMGGHDELHGDDGDDKLFGEYGNDKLYGGEGQDKLLGGEGNDRLSGGTGDDVLQGGKGADTLLGGEGNDTLISYQLHERGAIFTSSSSSNDEFGGGQRRPYEFDNSHTREPNRLEGGKGNDEITGSHVESDVFVFNKGDGQDTILKSQEGHHLWYSAQSPYGLARSPQDTLEFGEGIDPSDLTLVRIGSDLIIYVGEDGDQITVQKWFEMPNDVPYFKIDNFVFSDEDETIWTVDQIEANIDRAEISGTDAGERIVGTDAHDVIDAGAGNDQIEPGKGNDTIETGAGDDRILINAGEGHDVVRVGSGKDNIYLDGGIAANRVTYAREGDDLMILIDGGDDQSIRVEDHFNGAAIDYVVVGGYIQPANRIEQQLGETTEPEQPKPDVTTTPDTTGSETDTSGNNGGSETEQPEPEQPKPEEPEQPKPEEPKPEKPVEPKPDVETAEVDTNMNGVHLGSTSNDSFSGSGQDETFQGGDGQDTYIIGRNAGQDVVIDAKGGNIIRFVDGIQYNEVSMHLMRMGDNLELSPNGGPDKVIIKDFFVVGPAAMERIEFEAGGSLTGERIFQVFGMPVPNGSAAAETEWTTGTSGNDELTGDANANHIDGGAGNDTLTGSAGNDVLKGGQGDDTYVFQRGFGQDVIDGWGGGHDTIRFEGNIGFMDVAQRLLIMGDDLILSVAGTEDKVTVKDFFIGGDYAIDMIQFGDGSSLSKDRLFQTFGKQNNQADSPNYGAMPNAQDFDQISFTAEGNQDVRGGNEKDFILTGAGNDRIQGNAGNDYLVGGQGSDRFVFAKGDGQDRVNLNGNQAQDQDRIELSNVETDQLWLQQAGNDLVINRMDSDDQITLEGWFETENRPSVVIQAGNQQLTTEAADRLVRAMAEFDGDASNNDEPGAMPESVQASLADYWSAKS